jgi:MoaA/NifB/PqqE/SkfB family radical SAM enzyme
MINLKNIKKSGDENYSTVSFAWLMNTVCQYRCSYCFFNEHLNKKEKNKNKIAYKNVLKRLKMKNMKKFKIDLLGGEPTLHQNFFNILDDLCLNEKCVNIDLVTNLAKNINFFKNLNKPEYKKLTVSASYHPQYDKNNKFLRKCIEMVNLKNIKFIVNVNLSCNNLYWDQTIKLIDELIENKLDIGLNYLHSVENLYENKYDDKFYKKFENYIKENENIGRMNVKYTDKNNCNYTVNEYFVKKNKLHMFKGFNCKAMYWIINPDGSVYNQCTRSPLNILNNNIDKIISCPVTTGCNCEVMYNFPKYRDEI